MWDRANGLIVRAGVVYRPQPTCPIALGDFGDWVDSADGNAFKTRMSDGTDIVRGGSADVQVLQATMVMASALAANDYDNGTLGVGATLTGQSVGALSSIDGQSIVVGKTILVTGESADANNGLYTVTVVGTGSVKYKLTRAQGFNESADMKIGTLFVILAGSTYGSTTWKYTGAASPTVGTTSLTFAAAPISITYGLVGAMATDGVAAANNAGVAASVSRTDHVHAFATDMVATKEVNHIIYPATSTTATTAGADMTVRGGIGATSGAGGSAKLIGGVGGNAGAGGTAVVTGGAAGAATTAGGAAAMTGGLGLTTGAGGASSVTGGAGGNDAVGGAVSCTGGAAGGGNRAGGACSNTGGAGAGSAAGGAASLVGGLAGATGAGGAVAVTGGAGGATSGNGGAVAIAGGAGTAGDGNGGAVSINGGAKNGSGADGDINIGVTTGTNVNISKSGGKVGFFAATAVVKQTATADVTGFVAGSGTASKSDSVWAGPTGATAYTVGDIVKALKAFGLLTA